MSKGLNLDGRWIHCGRLTRYGIASTTRCLKSAAGSRRNVQTLDSSDPVFAAGFHAPLLTRYSTRPIPEKGTSGEMTSVTEMGFTR